MSSRILSLLLIFALSICSAAGADLEKFESEPAPPSGEAAAKLMRGYWVLAKREPDMAATVTLILQDNGKLVLEEVYELKTGGNLKITKKGKWWVEGGTCYGEFTESSHPDIAPVGYTTKDTILRLDDRVMELRTKEGDFERWERNIG